jgi:chemotaxis signal transduction protein
MDKILLFQVGTTQYGIDLARVRGIKSAKPILTGGTESGICFSRLLDGIRTPFYDLVSIFGDKVVTHGVENEKLIMVELQGHPLAMIVSGVNQVIHVQRDRLMPLSPVFEGPSRSCFPNAIHHEGSLILLLRPEGIVKVVEEAGDHRNITGMQDSRCGALPMEEDITLKNDVSTLESSNDISLVERWKSEMVKCAPVQSAADEMFKPFLEKGEAVDMDPEIFDLADVDDESHCESVSFLAHHLHHDREASPKTKPDGI